MNVGGTERRPAIYLAPSRGISSQFETDLRDTLTFFGFSFHRTRSISGSLILQRGKPEPLLLCSDRLKIQALRTLARRETTKILLRTRRRRREDILEEILDAKGWLSTSHRPAEIGFIVNRIAFPWRSNHRIHPRALTTMRATYTSRDHSERKRASVQNIGWGGLFLQTPDPFPPSTLLRMNLNSGPRSISLEGVVVFRRTPNDNEKRFLPAGMGVQLEPMSMESFQQLTDHVEKRLLRIERLRLEWYRGEACRSFIQRGEQSHFTKEYERAEKLFEQAGRIVAPSKEHIRLELTSMRWLAFVYCLRRRHEEAYDLLQKAIALYNLAEEPLPAILSSYFSALHSICLELGLTSEAEDWLRRAAAFR